MDQEARGLSDRLVLCYHAISETFPAALSITPARLEAHLALLARRGYRGVTFSDAVAGTSNGPVVAVTFDDACRSVRTLGRPILDRLGWPATMFAPTDWVGREEPMRWPGIERWHGGPHEHELMPMGWEELGALAQGGWEIGSHTCSHPRLPTLADAQLADELARSKAVCEECMGRPCSTIAYPYGDVDARVVAAVGAAGYTAAATLPTRLHDEQPLQWPRIGVYVADDARRFALKVSPPLRTLRRSGTWNALRRGWPLLSAGR